jgi:hypothetical protein
LNKLFFDNSSFAAPTHIGPVQQISFYWFGSGSLLCLSHLIVSTDPVSRCMFYQVQVKEIVSEIAADRSDDTLHS